MTGCVPKQIISLVDWAIIIGTKATLYVLLSDSWANHSEDARSLGKAVYDILGNPTSIKHKRDVEYIS